MHCGRLECSANLGSRTAFHQMQYDSNYHTQVVCQRSHIVDNDYDFFDIVLFKNIKLVLRISLTLNKFCIFCLCLIGIANPNAKTLQRAYLCVVVVFI